MMRNLNKFARRADRISRGIGDRGLHDLALPQGLGRAPGDAWWRLRVSAAWRTASGMGQQRGMAQQRGASQGGMGQGGMRQGGMRQGGMGQSGIGRGEAGPSGTVGGVGRGSPMGGARPSGSPGQGGGMGTGSSGSMGSGSTGQHGMATGPSGTTRQSGGISTGGSGVAGSGSGGSTGGPSSTPGSTSGAGLQGRDRTTWIGRPRADGRRRRHPEQAWRRLAHARHLFQSWFQFIDQAESRRWWNGGPQWLRNATGNPCPICSRTC